MKLDAGGKLWTRKPSAAAGGQRGEHGRAGSAGLRESNAITASAIGDDRADARREAVDAVGEVDDVHHRDQADDGDRRAAGVRELQHADERQRDRPARRRRSARRSRAASDLAGELDQRGRSKRSSSAPTSVITAPRRAARPVPQLPAPWPVSLAGSQISAATSVPAKIASPPSSGVGRSERPARAARRPRRPPCAKRIVSGVSSAVTAAATRKA